MRIEEISENDRQEALNLVLTVFMKYEAPEYSEQGIQSFQNFIGNQNEIDNLKLYGAFMDQKLTGVIATRNHGNHISLFFVDDRYHRQGIGRRLFEHILPKSTGEKITVNSSPYAAQFYKRLGFTADSCEQVVDGIRFTPMTYIK